ncbi:ABC transporter permease subunit [Stutzerimonas stutzeri]|uniref:ABC transporter permease subunit n=1 Tax=Stutzerimonas stutzeri TaxID=316 RepID=UPI00300E96F7
MYISNLIISFRLAFRARFLWIAGAAVTLLILATLLSSFFSGRQPATVALDIGLSIIRLLLPLILILMTQELLSREFERRYFLNTLSYPHSRHSILLSRFIGVASLALSLLIVLSGTLASLVWLISRNYAQATPVSLGYHYLITVAFIGIDVILLTTVATLLAVVASTPSLVLVGTFSFMLISRSFGSIIELLTRNATVVHDAESYRSGITILSYLLPDLGALDVRMITLYGKLEFLPDNWPLVILSCFSYMVGMLGLAVWSLHRKHFA